MKSIPLRERLFLKEVWQKTLQCCSLCSLSSCSLAEMQDMLDIVSFFSDVFKVIYLPELLLSSLIILETKIKQVGNTQKKKVATDNT